MSGLILVVSDDNSGYVREIAGRLRSQGCDVRLARTASEAASLCRGTRFDLVISRVFFLSGINGVDLVQQLRRLETRCVLFDEFPEEILRNFPAFPPPEVAFFRLPGDLDRLLQTVSSRLQSEGRVADFTAAPSAAEALQPGMWEVDLNTNTVRLSREYYRLFGIEPCADLQALEALEAHVHQDDREAVRRAFDQAVVQGRHLYRARFRVVWSDGSIHWLCARGKIEYAEAGKPVRASGVTVYESKEPPGPVK